MATPNTRRNPDAEDNDLYTTPIEALEALWESAPRILKNCTSVTDPAFGLGDISKFFKSKGINVVGYDINNYGDEFTQWNEHTEYLDFLKVENSKLIQTNLCVMNPPFTLTAEFVDKTLEVWDNVFMFNRLTTLESIKRATKFKSKEWPLRKVWVFSKRVSCPKGVDYEQTANSTAYCWYWLDRGYDGDPTIDWI